MFIFNKRKEKMKTVIHIILVAAIIVLGYFLFESILTPQRFNKEQEARYKVTIEKLKDIRTAQVAFKAIHTSYAETFDTLVHFVTTDSFAIVKAIGRVTDSMLDVGINEAKALKLGLISRDTIRVSVLDSLFSPTYPINEIMNVPFAKNEQFKLKTALIATQSGLTIPVFEVSVLNNTILNGMDRQLVVNFNAERVKMVGYPGLKVGSILEATNNEGNWE